MDRLHGINVFLRIVEVGTISGTARDLGLSTAAISASLARLETNLAVRLLDRTTRRLSVTAEGAEFYERCKKLMSDLDEAEQSISRIGRDPRVNCEWGCHRVYAECGSYHRYPDF